MWRFDVRCVDPLRMQRVDDPVSDVGRIGRIADMLKLAPTTRREMTTHWRCMVGTGFDRAVGVQMIAGGGKRRMAAIRRHTLPPRRNPDDQVGVIHSVAGKR